MKRIFFAAVFIGLMVGIVPCAQGQFVEDLSEQRKNRIIENLKAQFTQLQQYDVVMAELRASEIPGLDWGRFVINGQQDQEFLVTRDDKKLYLIAAGPVDVSRTQEELAAERSQAQAVEAAEAQQRHRELLELVAALPVRGNPEAPVTIIEFSDFECPYCARAARTVETLLEKYPDDVRLIYAHFPLPNHPWARPAAIATICAAEQDEEAFWALHDYYFQNQGQINPGNIIDVSKTVLETTEVDLTAWATCAEDTEAPSHQAAVEAVESWLSTGRSLGVSGTPGFFINGYYLSGAKPLADFEEAVAQAKDDVE